MSLTTDVTFDLTQASPVASAAGYTRTTRSSLQNEGLVKFRESFVKKLQKTPLTCTMQVTSYKPSEMENKSNFFYAIAQFATAAMFFQTWFRSHFADNVFKIVEKYTMPADPNANPPRQNDTESVREVGDLFKIWNAITIEQVYESCDLYMKYSNSAIEAQNLNLTWEFLMVNIDADLRAAVIAEISRFKEMNPDAAQSGPMAFFILANRIIQSTDALAHNVVSGIMTMGLIHFKGENVVEAVATLRNVLLFLGHGTQRSKCPPTLMDVLFDVFLRCSNSTFVSYIRHLKDFEKSTVDTPEKLFSKAQAYYTDLLTKPNGWVRTTKNRAAFLAELPELSVAMQAELEASMKPKAKSSPSEKQSTPSKHALNASSQFTFSTTPPSDLANRPKQDRKGNPIDRTPPKKGESHIRTNPSTQRKEFWCGHQRCWRWGGHTEDRHDQFFEKLKQRNNSKGNTDSKKPEETPTVPSMHGATFASMMCQPINPSSLFSASLNDDDSYCSH